MTAREVPLTTRQVRAASALRVHMPGWIAGDQALADVAARLPEMDPATAFIKIAVLDRLYGTNVKVIRPMAKHVAAVFRDVDVLTGDPTALVERLARTDKNRWSFAAKFCHFFVDPTRFPIYDKYALGTVACHLGRRRKRDVDHPYHAFVLNLQVLRERAGLECSWAELDRYLYLAGQYDVWKRNNDALINKEAARLFASKAPEVVALRAVMDGTAKEAGQ